MPSCRLATLFVLVGWIALVVARAVRNAKSGAPLSDLYTKELFLRLFVVLPLLCGVVMFVFAFLAPHQRECVPLLIVSLLLIGNLIVWRQLPSADQCSVASRSASPGQPIADSEEWHREVRNIGTGLVMRTLVIVSLVLIGVYALVHQRTVIGLILIFLCPPVALSCLRLTEKLQGLHAKKLDGVPKSAGKA